LDSNCRAAFIPFQKRQLCESRSHAAPVAGSCGSEVVANVEPLRATLKIGNRR
jgi:hypothetical protein